jgi:hypothetical protein
MEIPEWLQWFLLGYFIWQVIASICHVLEVWLRNRERRKIRNRPHG